MEAFKERLLTERDELSDRINSLQEYIEHEDSNYRDLSEIHQGLLVIQINAMITYKVVLDERCKLLGI